MYVDVEIYMEMCVGVDMDINIDMYICAHKYTFTLHITYNKISIARDNTVVIVAM